MTWRSSLWHAIEATCLSMAGDVGQVGVFGSKSGHRRRRRLPEWCARALAEPGRLRGAASVVLAVTSGATDAVAFLALGGAFTSVMTGNLVLLGISLGRPDLRLAEQVVLAVIGYIVGCAVGARLAGSARPDDPEWPPAVTRSLAVETALLGAFAIAWWSLAGRPDLVAQPPLLGVCALALGIQSSAVRRFGVSGLSTTYLTGTLTTVVISLARGQHVRDVMRDAGLLIALVIGAVLATVCMRLPARNFVPVVQLLPLVMVLALAPITASRLGGRRGG